MGRPRAADLTCDTLMTRGNMSRRFGLLSAVAIATLFPVAGLFSQENLPNTLQQLQETLKRLQNEVKTLQNTVQRLTKEAKNNKGVAANARLRATAAVASPGIGATRWMPISTGRQLERSEAIPAGNRGLQPCDSVLIPRAMRHFCIAVIACSNSAKTANAVSDFTQSLALQPNSSRAYLARALALAASGQDEKAMSDAGQALQRDPQYLDAYLLRGRLYQCKVTLSWRRRISPKRCRWRPNPKRPIWGGRVCFESAGQPSKR